MRALCRRIVDPLSADAYFALSRLRSLLASASVLNVASWTAQPVEAVGVGSTPWRAREDRAPNRSPKARTKGLRDCLAASAGVAGAATDSVMGWRSLAPPASSGFTGVPIGSGGIGVSAAAIGAAAPVVATTTRVGGVPIGSGGIGVSAAAIGAAAPVVATTTRVVIFPGRFVGRSVEGRAGATALLVPFGADLAGP